MSGESWRDLARAAVALLRQAALSAPSGYRESLSHLATSLERLVGSGEAT